MDGGVVMGWLLPPGKFWRERLDIPGGEKATLPLAKPLRLGPQPPRRSGGLPRGASQVRPPRPGCAMDTPFEPQTNHMKKIKMLVQSYSSTCRLVIHLLQEPGEQYTLLCSQRNL